MSIYERFERHAHRTFAEAATKYLNEFQGKDEHRQEIAVRSLLPYIGQLRCIDVDDDALQPFKADRLSGTGPFDRPALAGTVNKELTVAATVLNKACRVWRWLPSAPKILHVRGRARRAYPISWEEQERLFGALPTGWERCAALFAVNTGVRKAELFGLRWADMVPVPELETFVFVLHDTKNGESRAVICNSIARRAVNYLRSNGTEFVFPARWDRGRIRQSGKVWAAAWVRAGLPADPMTRKGIHNLRHTFAHRLRAAGVPQEDRNALLGHQKSNLAEHYALPDIQRLSAAAELITVRRDTVVLREGAA